MSRERNDLFRSRHILMAEIIQRLTGQSARPARQRIYFRSSGHEGFDVQPAEKDLAGNCADGIDDRFRHRLIQGEVHDENAYSIGGVSGHAGVFSTSPDLAAFCQMLLNGGVYAHTRIVKRSTLEGFILPQPLAKNTRTIGWVVPTENRSAGHYFSVHSYGHTGFTGTTSVIDPDRQVFVVLLTNRVNPTRENMKIAQVRPAFTMR